MLSIKPKKTLQKRFIAAESDTLIIETIQTESTAQPSRLRLLKLKGTWFANKYNELCFTVSMHKGPPETYTFKGSWKLNNNQQIEYTSEDGRDTLTFKGYWNISSTNRLVYSLEGSSTSRFEFKVQLESPSLYPKKGEIRYRIGIGIRQSRVTSPNQVLILYGEWKFGRNLALSFQMDYGQGNIKSIEFGAEVTFGPNKVIFALKDDLGKSVGITLTMSRKFLDHHDAEIFLRLKSLYKEQAIEVGLTIPF
ncbi:MAG: hypothetical protein WC543_04935 [Candidatus Omnitrophota bacterium]